MVVQEKLFTQKGEDTQETGVTRPDQNRKDGANSCGDRPRLKKAQRRPRLVCLGAVDSFPPKVPSTVSSISVRPSTASPVVNLVSKPTLEQTKRVVRGMPHAPVTSQAKEFSRCLAEPACASLSAEAAVNVCVGAAECFPSFHFPLCLTFYAHVFRRWGY